MINGISNLYGTYSNPYSNYTNFYGTSLSGSTTAQNGMTNGIGSQTTNNATAAAQQAASGFGISPGQESDGRVIIRNPGESTEKQAGKESSPAECKTCKERKYQDGSDEDVSFKSAAHIDPDAAAARVRSHEQEHVSNAYKKAAQNNGKVMSCNVSIHTSVCPECGRTYVSGGTTATQIKYYNEENPYQKEMKSSDAANKYLGMNLDIAC